MNGINFHHPELWFYTVNTEKYSAVIHTINHQTYLIPKLAAVVISLFFSPLFIGSASMCVTLLSETLSTRGKLLLLHLMYCASFLLQNVLNCKNSSSTAFSVSITELCLNYIQQIANYRVWLLITRHTEAEYFCTYIVLF